MGLFRKKPDPLAQSERLLNRKIAALEGEIRALNERLGDPASPGPARPGLADPGAAGRAGADPAAPPFEDVNHQRVHAPSDGDTTPGHFNELGVRKYDPIATCRRWLAQLRGGPTANPKLVSYLAAGSIHGLRPLRYEKRIARNRFLALCAFFLAILWGLIYIYLKNR